MKGGHRQTNYLHVQCTMYIYTCIFLFRYHDVDGVPDFLVLKSVYDASITTSWTAGDRFKSLMKDGYFYGKVLSEQPFE